MKIKLSLLALLISGGASSQIMSPAGNKPPTKPADTEVYEPAVKVVQAYISSAC